MGRHFVRTLAVLAVVSVATLAAAQGLPDLGKAKALDKCHVILDRTSAKLAVKKLKTLDKCADAVLKCLETKPAVPRCVEQARETCEEQLTKAVGEEAKLIDAVARKCATDLSVDDLLDPAGLDLASVASECTDRFQITLTDMSAAGTCLTRQHACELERAFAVAAPRAASLLAVAGVDPAMRAALGCLTDHGGADEHVADTRVVGRAVEKCARAIKNAGLKLVDTSARSLGRCLDTIFTCVQVKNDPSASPACMAKAQKRCDLEFTNLAAAATRPAAALAKACGAIDIDVLRSPEGLRLASLATECQALGAGDPLTLADYADCLSRRQRCTVAELARFRSPRTAALLTLVGRNFPATLCPSADSATPTPTPSATGTAPDLTPTATPTPTVTATATDTTPTVTPTPSDVATATDTTPTATPTPTSGCADAYEPNAFPAAPADLSSQCGGTCSDAGYTITLQATIDSDSDDDFYTVDVVDQLGEDFSLRVRLDDVPHDTNYDLYLYRLNGGTFEEVDQSTNDGTGAEVARYDGDIGDNSGTYGIEVRRVSGSSCDTYSLEIQDPS